jgi:hypothetical protein
MCMFRQVLTFVTAAAFVAHGLLGCCWFGAQNFGQINRVISRAAPVGCCKPCQHTHEKGCPHEGPCRLHCRGVCVYVSPQKSQVDARQIDMRFDFAAVVVSQRDNHPLAAAEVRGSGDDPREAEPPARLHLLHQIFLI